ncbi:hypothetical protein KEM54_004509 [Ascosphaera aggregata]|nr:hypothetical protein KEM54_004509 [Ascosphaera aggregata]
MGSDPQYIRYPDLSLAQHVFNLSNSYTTPQVRSASIAALQTAIRDNAMAPLYKHLAHPVDGVLNGGGSARERSMSVQLDRFGGPAVAAATAGATAAAGGAIPVVVAAAGATAAAAAATRAVSPGATTPAMTPGANVSGPVIVSNMLAPKKLGGMSSAQIKEMTLPWDESLYKELEARNNEELAKLAKEQEEVAESGVESDVQAVIGKRAEYFAKIGDKDKAIQTFENVLSSTSLLGTKIDILLAETRTGLFFGDKTYVQSVLDRASAIIETGGDWDRRNRLKAYRGLHLLTVRNYAAAAPLLLDSLATFTSYELCTYSELVVFSVMAGSLALKRVDFKSKVVDAPEIKAILGDGEVRLDALSGSKDEEMTEAPSTDATQSSTDNANSGHAAIVNLTTLGSDMAGVNVDEAPMDFSPLANLVSSLYNGAYKFFFQSLAAVEDSFLKVDRYLFEHRAWFVREMRLRGYAQLLQSYRVVGLQSMADAFGVSVDYLDRDLAKFIASDRIACTIDRVNGIIETNRADDKNKQYADVVKQGDALITKLQKYGQAVRMRGSERA